MSEINGTKVETKEEKLFRLVETNELQSEQLERQSVMLKYAKVLGDKQEEKIDNQSKLLEVLEVINENLESNNELLDSRAFKAEKAVLKWIWFTGISLAAALGLIAHISQS